ncbi:MAG TPA: hypothetical protein VI704_04085, partial [Bacteroidota bacterium]|nr:hypothetical protein [Bacteroidota bacterium]
MLRTLVWGAGSGGVKLTAPFVQVDRLQGEYSGGRWVFANFRGMITEKAIKFLVDQAADGPVEFIVRPSFACYRVGEVPSLSLQLKTPLGDVKKKLLDGCEIEVVNENNEVIDRLTTKFHGDGDVATAEVTMSDTTKLLPGLYRVQARQQLKSQASGLQYASNGFWVYDEKLMGSGAGLSTDGTYFVRNGEPYPVTGTTYMASDVARKFLF